MKERRAVTDTPFGSPEAGAVQVYTLDEDGNRVLVREEDPWESDLAPGTTLGGDWPSREEDR